jgi:hypothetical protein
MEARGAQGRRRTELAQRRAPRGWDRRRARPARTASSLVNVLPAQARRGWFKCGEPQVQARGTGGRWIVGETLLYAVRSLQSRVRLRPPGQEGWGSQARLSIRGAGKDADAHDLELSASPRLACRIRLALAATPGAHGARRWRNEQGLRTSIDQHQGRSTDRGSHRRRHPHPSSASSTNFWPHLLSMQLYNM